MSTKLLLSGPPGTGKTMFARSLCNSLQVPMFTTSVATWLEPGYLGDVFMRIKRAFSEVVAHQPAILFIDEIDGIGRRTDFTRDYADYWNALVNCLLELLDGAARTTGVIVVGATNAPGDHRSRTAQTRQAFAPHEDLTSRCHGANGNPATASG